MAYRVQRRMKRQSYERLDEALESDGCDEIACIYGSFWILSCYCSRLRLNDGGSGKV